MNKTFYVRNIFTENSLFSILSTQYVIYTRNARRTMMKRGRLTPLGCSEKSTNQPVGNKSVSTIPINIITDPVALVCRGF